MGIRGAEAFVCCLRRETRLWKKPGKEKVQRGRGGSGGEGEGVEYEWTRGFQKGERAGSDSSSKKESKGLLQLHILLTLEQYREEEVAPRQGGHTDS